MIVLTNGKYCKTESPSASPSQETPSFKGKGHHYCSPSPTPSETVSPAPTPTQSSPPVSQTPSAPPTSASATVSVSGSPTQATLPVTGGSDNGLIAGSGAVLLLVGTVAVWATRRKYQARHR